MVVETARGPLWIMAAYLLLPENQPAMFIAEGRNGSSVFVSRRRLLLINTSGETLRLTVRIAAEIRHPALHRDFAIFFKYFSSVSLL